MIDRFFLIQTGQQQKMYQEAPESLKNFKGTSYLHEPDMQKIQSFMILGQFTNDE